MREGIRALAEAHQDNGKDMVQEEVQEHQHDGCEAHEADRRLRCDNLHLHPRGLPGGSLQQKADTLIPYCCSYLQKGLRPGAVSGGWEPV